MSGAEGAMLTFALAAAVASLFVLYDWLTHRKDRGASPRR